MDLTPLDIHHKEFHRAIRGYNEEEVDVFLDQAADQFEQLFNQNRDLKEQVEKMQEKVDQYAGIEQTLQRALLTAQQAADEVQSNAQRESELIIRDAELKSKEIIQNIVTQKQEVQADLAALKSAEKEFRSRFKGLLESYLETISKVEKSERPEPEPVITMDEAAENEPVANQMIETEEEETTVFLPPAQEPMTNEPSGEPKKSEDDAAASAYITEDAAAKPAEPSSNASEDVNPETAMNEGEKNEAKKAEGENKPKSANDFDDFFDKSSFFGEEEDKPEEKKEAGKDDSSSSRSSANEAAGAFKPEQPEQRQEINDRSQPRIRFDYPEPEADKKPGAENVSTFFDDTVATGETGQREDQPGIPPKLGGRPDSVIE